MRKLRQAKKRFWAEFRAKRREGLDPDEAFSVAQDVVEDEFGEDQDLLARILEWLEKLLPLIMALL